MSDRERLDWLERNKADLIVHRNKSGEGDHCVSWDVVKSGKSISGHPLGSHRAAIDAAIKMSRRDQESGAVKNNKVPFLILADKRTVEIATAIIQQEARSIYGTAKLTAATPPIIKSRLYAEIVTWVSESQSRQTQLARFYLTEWSALPFQRRDHTLAVRWDVAAHAALEKIARRLASKDQKRRNKSLAFCVVIAFAARRRYGIVAA